ncbi:MAG: FAD-dependent oxidoreductase [Woeseiaceae bacterium]|nr:FAD-dependent oxidoreductase [Woeseiaceae bacterium]
MKIAIVGTGIAGNVAAYMLRDRYDITVYEAGSYIGGHTNTIDVEEGGRQIPVDTGFIVFNDRTYPNFIRILDEIGQESQPSVMSFSVRTEDDRLEYNGATLNTLFAQRRNLFRPSFHRMIRDILRFNDTAVASLENEDPDQPVGEYLRRHGYSDEFLGHYLIPMAAAIWSSEPVAVADMPLRFLVRFFHNHGLLQLKDRPQWRVIKGGSREYVGKLVAGHMDSIRINAPVQAITRHLDGVEVTTAEGGNEWYDAVFLACHSDQALRMLSNSTPAEHEVLGAIEYQDNEAVLHTDASVMPRRRRAWAAWNYHLPRDPASCVPVTYNMNILQSLDAEHQYCVTLNNDEHIDPDKIIRRIQYQHPIYKRATIAAQARQQEINCERTYFCGAYWRNGFHEDGVVSAMNAVEHFEERLRYGELHLRRAG